MIQTFNDPVISVLHYSKLMAGFFNPLVVGAVNDKTAAIEPVRDGIGQCGGEMIAVCLVKSMCQISGQVLADRASKIDIDQLHAFTNAKHGFCSGNKAMQQPQLGAVKQRFDLPGSMVRLVEQDGVDITAARKEKTVIIMDQKRIFQILQGGYKGTPKCKERFFIVGSFVWRTGNQDWLHRISFCEELIVLYAVKYRRLFA